MSKKFTAAQHNYHVFEVETIAILEALLKWEDKLIGRHIHIITDHKALEFFKMQKRMSNRQMHWMEFFSHFEDDIEYIKGDLNKVADCLSRYYKNDAVDEIHDIGEYVNADSRLDPDGEELPWGRMDKLRSARMSRGNKVNNRMRKNRKLQEQVEERIIQSKELADHEERSADQAPLDQEEDPTLIESINEKEVPPLDMQINELKGIEESIQQGYKEDKLFSKILEEPDRYSTFIMRDNLMYSTNFEGREVLCIPRTMHDRRRLTEIIIDQGHMILGHFGTQKTSEYIRRWYWWPSIGKDITKFCESCGTCQSIKTSNKKPFGLLHSMPIPAEPWKAIAMDFVGPFPLSKGFDYLWIVIDRLTSMLHLIPINTTMKASELSWLYIKEIICLHGIPELLVSDRDSKFTLKFWKEVHILLGTKLLMSTAFHPETDGASERAIRSIAQILRSMVKPDQKDWVEKIPLVEFAINSSISKSTGFAPFELNYGYMPVTEDVHSTSSERNKRSH
jgi:hypothetical protein